MSETTGEDQIIERYTDYSRTIEKKYGTNAYLETEPGNFFVYFAVRDTRYDRGRVNFIMQLYFEGQNKLAADCINYIQIKYPKLYSLCVEGAFLSRFCNLNDHEDLSLEVKA